MARRLLREDRQDGSGTRTSRAMKDRARTGNREVTDAERLNMFRKTMHQSALPDLPKIPGYHVCWLTTANPRDSIPARMRLGYEPIRPEDVPGWHFEGLKSGEYEGCIGINEMVAFKIPSALYQGFMEFNHHEEPLAQERMLEYNAEKTAEEASGLSRRKRKVRVFEGEGNAELGQDSPIPDFSALAGDRQQLPTRRKRAPQRFE